MALALSKEQLAKLNKKDILQLLLESMEQEKELRSQLAVLTDELKRTNQQMQVILENKDEIAKAVVEIMKEERKKGGDNEDN